MLHHSFYMEPISSTPYVQSHLISWYLCHIFSDIPSIRCSVCSGRWSIKRLIISHFLLSARASLLRVEREEKSKESVCYTKAECRFVNYDFAGVLLPLPPALPAGLPLHIHSCTAFTATSGSSGKLIHETDTISTRILCSYSRARSELT